jgi:predicted HTH domain antitoxin
MENVKAFGGNMNTLTIEYPFEVLWALQEEPEEFAADARLLLAVKLHEMGKSSTGLAAQLAGIPRVTFFFLLGKYGASPFGETVDEIEEDLAHARQAGHCQEYSVSGVVGDKSAFSFTRLV